MSARGRRHAPAKHLDLPPGPVQVRTIYERFPITVKGAFVLRGGDANPHTAEFVSSSVTRIPDGEGKPVPFERGAVDVAPARDLFLPFEASIGDLEPGWYVVRANIKVDGAAPTAHDSRPFSVPWPRGTMATGSVAAARTVKLGGRAVSVERVELRSDRVEVLWRSEGWEGEDPRFEVSVGGETLQPLPANAGGPADAGSGRRRAVSYPAPRGSDRVTVEVRAPDGTAAPPFTLRLS